MSPWASNTPKISWMTSSMRWLELLPSSRNSLPSPVNAPPYCRLSTRTLTFTHSLRNMRGARVNEYDAWMGFSA